MITRTWLAPAGGKPPPPLSPPGRPADDGETAAHASTGPAVLIVEDNWLVSLELEAALLDAGYSVPAIAVSAEEALSACETLKPDLILMDIRLLGERDGVDAAIEARRRFDIPSIFLSAHDDAQIQARAADARPLAWLSKPMTPDHVIACLESLLAPRQ